MSVGTAVPVAPRMLAGNSQNSSHMVVYVEAAGIALVIPKRVACSRARKELSIRPNPESSLRSGGMVCVGLVGDVLR
jgi:hypothetical protein